MTNVSAVATRIKLVSTSRYLPSQPLPITLAPRSDVPSERTLARTIIKAFPVLEERQWSLGGLPLRADEADEYIKNGGLKNVVADRSQRSLHDFALHTASALLGSFECVPRVNFLIYTYASAPADFDIAGACFLKFRLGLKDTVPFSIGQANAASFLFALRIAADLDGPCNDRAATSVITTSDRWVTPLPRVISPFAAAGDAATACYVCDLSDPIEGWPVLAIANLTIGHLADPHNAKIAPDTVLEELFSAVKQAILAVLEVASIKLDKVRWVIPQSVNHLLCHRVTTDLLKGTTTIFRTSAETYGFLSSSDTPFALSLFSEDARCNPGDLVLVWSAGAGGSVSASLLAVGNERLKTLDVSSLYMGMEA